MPNDIPTEFFAGDQLSFSTRAAISGSSLILKVDPRHLRIQTASSGFDRLASLLALSGALQ
jgi:hypothetical protein